MTVNNPDIELATIGARVSIKNPAAAANTLFATYQRIPGSASVQLPNDQAQNNEIVTLEGIGQVAGFQRLGNATITLAKYIPYHPAISYLRSIRGTKNKVLAQVELPSETVFSATGGITAISQAGVATPATTAGLADSLDRLVQVGMCFEQGNNTWVIIGVNRNAAGKLQTLQVASQEGALPSTAISTAFDLKLVIPKVTFTDIRCQVAALSDGSLETESVMSGEITLTPTSAIGAPTIDAS